MKQKNAMAYKVALTGLIAALSYVVFTFLQIKIIIPGTPEATSIHLGNAICVLGALLLGGALGGIGGAIGMTVGDLLDPIYILSAPKTFILKLCIGLVTGIRCFFLRTASENLALWMWKRNGQEKLEGIILESLENMVSRYRMC